jgi:hypothetical protein
MARAGILTFHSADNYGAVLQCYALSRAVRELGHEPVVIDYRPLVARRAYNRLGLRSGRPVQKLIRRWKFRKFRNKYLPLSERCYLTGESLRADPPKLDCVLVGSDQVWNVHSFRGYDPAFFLDFVSDPKCRRASYAACVGTANDFGPQGDAVSALLMKFEHMSVRNIHSQDIVEKFSGRRPLRVLDPTFMAEFDELVSPPTEREPYIFVYSLRRDENFDKVVATVRAKLGMQVISLGLPFKNARTYYTAGPLDWLSLIRHASFVITNSFHGTCFSIFNHKNFLTMWVSEDKSRRHRDLLEWCGLPNRLVIEPGSVERMTRDDLRVDFSGVDARVAAAKEESRAFLKQALQS